MFVPASSLESISEEAVKSEADEDDDHDEDDVSDANTVIHQPQSPEPRPFAPLGFTGEIPRYYTLTNEMATLALPSSALGVLFPGDQVEQLRAQVAQVCLELAK
jgi:hypothetical protein